MTRLVAIIALIAALIGAGASFMLTSASKAKTIAELESKVSGLEAEQRADREIASREATFCASLDTAIKRQDKGITELAQRAAEQAAAANAAAAAARTESARFNRDAAALLASRPPAGADLCAAARTAFDDELRAERAGEP